MRDAANKPRVWTVFLAYAVVVCAVVAAGVIVFVVALIGVLGNPDVEPDLNAVDQIIERAFMEPWVMLACSVCTALAFIVVALGAAKLGRTPIVERLRLGRPAGGWRRFAVALLACVSALGSGSVVISLLAYVSGGKSQALMLLDSAMRSSGLMLVSMFVVIAVVTPIGEELFFRGYAQTRLVARFGRPAGMAIATVLFALLHMDPMHMAGAFAIGIVLAWTTERTGSIRPAIVAHAVNNGISVIAAQTPSSSTSWGSVAAFAVAAGFALVGIAVLTRPAHTAA